MRLSNPSRQKHAARLPPYSWSAGNREGWRATLLDPALAVDATAAHVYVHGGRLPRQQNAVSCAVFRIDLSQDSAEPVPLYTEDDALRGVAALAQSPLDARECAGPARYGHILLRHDSYVVAHGGKDARGVTQSDLHGFHLQGRRWVLLKHVLGGCAPPRMSGHKVTPLGRAHPGVFIIVGVEQQPYVPNTVWRPKRLRDAPCVAHSTAGSGFALSVFCLDLADFQRGWSRVASSHAETMPALERVNIVTHARDDSPDEFPCDTTNKLARRDLFLFGQARRGAVARNTSAASRATEPQLWRLSMETGIWQQVSLASGISPSSHLAPPTLTIPACDVALAPFDHGGHPIREDGPSREPTMMVLVENSSAISSPDRPLGLCLGVLCPSRITTTPAQRAEVPVAQWADMVYLGLRLKRSPLCLLALPGATEGVCRLALIEATGKLFHADVVTTVDASVDDKSDPPRSQLPNE